MEIERKFLIPALPEDLETYPHDRIWQAYLCARPTIRIRRQGDEFILTVKGKGTLAHEEFELPLSEESFRHLAEKTDGHPVVKTRYRIPLPPYTVELDVFEGEHAGLWLAEVEFPSVEEAQAFTPPEWFGEDVTYDKNYRNVRLAGLQAEEKIRF
ncbi:MAG: CYTH domain-containing protein [Lachnospiraceae bacterium]|nr:CYTH domain-containing protein [Lachnospiraceae bacterium]